MSTTVLIDAGPIVALLRKSERYHLACDQVTKDLSLPAYSCWPVIAEAAHLLRMSRESVRELLASSDGSWIEILPMGKRDLGELDRILTKYNDQQFDLADVCLMHLAEREKIDTVFTLDHRHFSIYRTTRECR